MQCPCLKNANELPSLIMFPGALMDSSYFPHSFPRHHRNIRLLYLPMFPESNNANVNGRTAIAAGTSCGPCCVGLDSSSSFCLPLNVPAFLPAILIMKEADDDGSPGHRDSEDDSSERRRTQPANTDVTPTASYFIIHFHSNACDAGHIVPYAEREADAYDAQYLIVEYPRYGFAKGHPSENALKYIAIEVYHYVTRQLRVPPERIVLYGRSIGSGPACFLASYVQTHYQQQVHAVILHSPYSSLRTVAADVAGQCIHGLMLERFPNWQWLAGSHHRPCREPSSSIIRCPVLFIHADCDCIVDYEHSRSLHAARCRLGLPSELFTQQSKEGRYKGHNRYHFSSDIMKPIKEFLIRTQGSSVGVALPLDQIDQMTVVPRMYHSLSEASNSPSMSAAITQSASKALAKDVLCRLLCIPCFQSIECLLAMTDNLCERAAEVILNERPPFRYRTKSMRGEAQATCCGLLYTILKDKSLENVAQETDKAMEAIFLQRRSIETVNPLQGNTGVEREREGSRKQGKQRKIAAGKDFELQSAKALVIAVGFTNNSNQEFANSYEYSPLRERTEPATIWSSNGSDKTDVELEFLQSA